MSSFHDELENASSPSMPRTPASPAVNAKESSSHSKGSKVIFKKKKRFFFKLIKFNNNLSFYNRKEIHL